MAAKDYILAVTPLSNTVWICKQSKRDTRTMTGDRAKVDKSDFINIVLEWIHNQLEPTSDTLNITTDGKVVAEFKINREALGLEIITAPNVQGCDATGSPSETDPLPQKEPS